LGASDDTDLNKASGCSPSDNYIMTPDFTQYSENILNQYKFSNCSILSIKNNVLNQNYEYNLSLYDSLNVSL
jgi:hypothetical protein